MQKYWILKNTIDLILSRYISLQKNRFNKRPSVCDRQIERKYASRFPLVNLFTYICKTTLIILHVLRSVIMGLDHRTGARSIFMCTTLIDICVQVQRKQGSIIWCKKNDQRKPHPLLEESIVISILWFRYAHRIAFVGCNFVEISI